MTRRQITISVLIILLAALVRLVFLDIKPPHFDEGINGWWCDQMAKQGYYAYDPDNYHGPFHFYVLRVFLLAFGRNLWALRMPTVLVGTLTVGLLFSFTRFFGYRVTALAALATAVSPGFVFYERYAIHETWLVFFLILTKETYAIPLVAFVAAAFVAWAISKIVRGIEPESPTPIKIPWQTFTIGTLVSWPIFAIGFGLIWF